jgi:hypothetical protein
MIISIHGQSGTCGLAHPRYHIYLSRRVFLPISYSYHDALGETHTLSLYKPLIPSDYLGTLRSRYPPNINYVLRQCIIYLNYTMYSPDNLLTALSWLPDWKLDHLRAPPHPSYQKNNSHLLSFPFIDTTLAHPHPMPFPLLFLIFANCTRTV